MHDDMSGSLTAVVQYHHRIIDEVHQAVWVGLEIDQR